MGVKLPLYQSTIGTRDGLLEDGQQAERWPIPFEVPKGRPEGAAPRRGTARRESPGGPAKMKNWQSRSSRVIMGLRRHRLLASRQPFFCRQPPGSKRCLYYLATSGANDIDPTKAGTPVPMGGSGGRQGWRRDCPWRPAAQDGMGTSGMETGPKGPILNLLKERPHALEEAHRHRDRARHGNQLLRLRGRLTPRHHRPAPGAGWTYIRPVCVLVRFVPSLRPGYSPVPAG
ncbi:hypothetical protein FBZ89_107139 [Nitrospirillum amazonense]|uniref:Uncharacterized protein n=1 Tax=Nitrospirillum amazonense TaxID=28077 RepID=A0A560FFQ9_9PROT|nr:hypothetical protein FBZ89_107139 [Nitrospirillum amazonense]